MADVKASEVRAWVASNVEAVTGYSFAESPRLMGVDAEASSVAHQSFSVFMDAEEDTLKYRQKSGGNSLVKQRVRVRFAWRVRPGADQISDYDAALDAAAVIVRQMMQIPTAGEDSLHVRYDGIPRRELVDGKWVLTDVAFTIFHTITLAAVA